MAARSKGRLVVVAYGMGVDSTAMLVGFHQRGIRPDLILFADTGGEKPETYAYEPIIQAWLKKVGFPRMITVRYVLLEDPEKYKTLEQSCDVNRTLPSLAFMGNKGCSAKWKIAPQNAYVREWPAAINVWKTPSGTFDKNGKPIMGKVLKAIGYDAGPADSKRGWDLDDDEKYEYWYPLREWGWDRERCKKEIAAAGLPVPPKSACFFCPATKPHELIELKRKHPGHAARIVKMEAGARLTREEKTPDPKNPNKMLPVMDPRTGLPRLLPVKVVGLWGVGSGISFGDMTSFLEALRVAPDLVHELEAVKAAGGPGARGRSQELMQAILAKMEAKGLRGSPAALAARERARGVETVPELLRQERGQKPKEPKVVFVASEPPPRTAPAQRPRQRARSASAGDVLLASIREAMRVSRGRGRKR